MAQPNRRRLRPAVWCALLALALAQSAVAQARRVVIIKADGLGAGVLDRWLKERDPNTGKSVLPWIEHVFVEGGAKLDSFYTRGISLSVPSWSMLDSGHHLVIRGNAEYDRTSARVYDYLNFFPFYFYNARSARADMPAVEVMDQSGIPLLIDSFRPEERLQAMQLFQRGVRWQTLRDTIPKRFGTRSVRQLFNEWQVGFELTDAVSEQVERELVAALSGDRVLYLDFFFGDYDHVVHLTNDETSQRQVVKKLDALVGRLWTAIERSPLARDTALVLLSDHGINSDSKVFSQGYSLIEVFNSAAGGGHHVLTNRHPMTEYKLRGLDPFVSNVVSASSESFYLKGESDEYPTAILDLDGNERASAYLRNSDINEMHLLLKRATDSRVPEARRDESARAVIAVIDHHRKQWRAEADELGPELKALSRAVECRRAALPRKAPKQGTDEVQREAASRWRRERAELNLWERQLRSYESYLQWLERLMLLKAETISSGRAKLEDLVPRRAPFHRNDIYRLQNYVVNLGASGFERVNYFSLLTGIRVRNNLQGGVSPKPVDFVAATIARDAIRAALPESEWPDRDAIFVYAGEGQQALILVRGDQIRFMPVRGFKQDADGSVAFGPQNPVPGLPLAYFEDPHFAAAPETFLSAWHTEREWFEATHRTRYSNGIIGLVEHFAPAELGPASSLWNGAESDDVPLLRRFALRLRNMTLPDLLILANDHWNFNVRGFNPGGNHGSFLRVSTHSVLMLAGAGIPRGLVVDRPYDSLSFVPTLLKVAGRNDGREFPGPVIEELFPR